MLQQIVVFCLLVHFSSGDFEKKNQIEYHFYSRENPNNLILLKSDNLINTEFNTLRPSVVIIPGYLSSGNFLTVKKMKDAYLRMNDCNVIIVDWSKYSMNHYSLSAFYTKTVGYLLANLLINLNASKGLNYTTTHLVGHCLGAHAAGFAGKRIFNITSKKIGKISALDPAGPLFYKASCSERICKTDARFTYVLHTDNNLLGFDKPLGHADFYANNGATQPDCQENFSVYNFLEDKFKHSACDHMQAYDYHTKSINSKRFVAQKCNNYSAYIQNLCENTEYVIMGENVNLDARGKYYCKTHSNFRRRRQTISADNTASDWTMNNNINLTSIVRK